MNVVQWKHSTKVAFGMLTLLFCVYLLLPRKNYKHAFVPRFKIRRPLSYYLKNIIHNDTLLKMVLEQEFLHPNSKEALRRYLRPNSHPKQPIVVSHQSEPQNFDVNTDVIVYIQIQKIGDTVFNNELITTLDKGFDCNCKDNVLMNPCHCKNKNGHIWLFSWFTVGWPCELHADWTMLHDCVDTALNRIEGKRTRRYFYITLLRDPLMRYLSEWRHQRLGNHWEEGKLYCDGKRVPLFEVRPCFNTETWFSVTLDEFMDCPENLATNRETRMLANLTKSWCYRKKGVKPMQRAYLQLESAMENLQHMPFFGITEKRTETQHYFEKVFGMKFTSSLERFNDSEEEELISEDEFINMMRFVELDIQLYLYANDLFSYRLERL